MVLLLTVIGREESGYESSTSHPTTARRNCTTVSNCLHQQQPRKLVTKDGENPASPYPWQVEVFLVGAYAESYP